MCIHLLPEKALNTEVSRNYVVIEATLNVMPIIEQYSTKKKLLEVFDIEKTTTLKMLL